MVRAAPDSTMAYSPLDQGRLLRSRELVAMATRHGANPAQVALAWLLQQEGVMVIPKAGKRSACARESWRAGRASGCARPRGAGPRLSRAGQKETAGIDVRVRK